MLTTQKRIHILCSYQANADLKTAINHIIHTQNPEQSQWKFNSMVEKGEKNQNLYAKNAKKVNFCLVEKETLRMCDEDYYFEEPQNSGNFPKR